MQVVHLIEGLRNEDGGPVVSLQNLIKSTDHTIEHTVLYERGEAVVLKRFSEGVNLHAVSSHTVANALEIADVLHVHGMWSLSQARIAKRAFKLGIPYIVSPRGMLEPWPLSQGRVKKQLFLLVLGYRLLCQAHAVHATAMMEGDHLPKIVKPEKIKVIPNVVEGFDQDDDRKDFSNIQALFLSRIHTKKGIFDLVPVWGALTAGSNHGLTICGPGEKDVITKLKSALDNLPDGAEIQFMGTAFGDKKVSCMRNANVFLLPSYSENYGNVIPEALSAGLPVLTTTGMPWAWLVEEGCGWVIEPGKDALRIFLKELFSMSAVNLEEMSAKAIEVYNRELNPMILGKKYMDLYQSMIS